MDRKQPEEARAEMARKISDRIDDEMRSARVALRVYESQDDPYAMHRAVEGLSTEVLCELIRARTVQKITD